ncbi:Imm21 family immunity protein [Kitasatospora sp. NPDC001547]|uniref:Imm21 family immunity protein n=1 Tax=Kitasatospora sp. NPDC001547 TaxID=3364015 RepID=UPI003691CA43
MSTDPHDVRMSLDLTWVESMGGPMVVVPLSALQHWGGCTEGDVVIGDSDQPDDYDRACEVEGLAEAIGLRGHSDASVLVLGDEPATTCYLPGPRVFMRWLAADSDAELLAATEAALDDPATPWEECGLWETDGPAVLMDSAEAGRNLGMLYPDGSGEPEQVPVPLPAGRWRVRAFQKTGADSPWISVVQLLPQADGLSTTTP